MSYLSVCFCPCSFCAKIQRTGFVTWSVSRCNPSFVAPRSTLSSFRRHLLTSSSSSGLILIGRPKREEAFHWIILIALTVIRSFILLQIPLNCHLLLHLCGPDSNHGADLQSTRPEYRLNDEYLPPPGLDLIF